MKNVVRGLVIASALACACACACACRDDANKVGTTETTSATLPQTTLTREDREFVRQARQAGMLQIALGNHVSRKAAAKDTRAFGQKMVVDRSLADEELKNIAAAKGVAVPSDLDADHRATYEELSKLEGTRLDEKYTDALLAHQERILASLREGVRELADPDLRGWAARTLPTFEDHLARANSLKATLAAGGDGDGDAR